MGPSDVAPPKNKMLISLQGLRGAAALLVVIDHSLATLAEKAGQRVDLSVAFFIGGLGVCVFFTISGFVMVVNHHQDFQRQKVVSFVLKRVGRVIPLYYITTCIYALKLTLQGSPPDLQSLFLSVLFIPHPSSGSEYGQPVYGLGWTLQYEMFFYAIFALSLFLSLGKGITITILTFTSLVVANHLGILNNFAEINYLSQPIVLYFVAGVVLGFLKVGNWRLLRARHLSPTSLFTFATGLAVCAIWLFSTTKSNAYAPIFCISACAICMLTSERPSTGLTASLMMLIGNATYSIYLTHSFVVGPAGRLAAKFPGKMSAVLFCALTVLICSALGVFVHRFVEKPLLHAWSRATAPLLKRIYGRRAEIPA
ncbi:acyltransferase [Aquincola sp. MAHUQ-54]|uniref:Acyltransferase n=1 Tax=Aquincola agrisoli TaxID=3119538 RepID=A0AAW9QQW1_9BURK